MRRALAAVLETEEITPGVFVTWYSAPELAEHAKPGQFVMVAPDAAGDALDPLLPRAFSYHRFRRREGELQFALLYRIAGRVTEQMAAQQPGDAAWMTGPLGKGFEVGRRARNLLLVAGGVGIAPLVALAEAELAGPAAAQRSIVLCHGSPGAGGAFPAALLPPQIDYLVATEDGSRGRRGLVTELFAEQLGWADQTFACGPNPMFRSMARIVRADGFHRNVQVLLETEMACGIGICYGCAVFAKRGVKLCCSDGPRFDLLDAFPTA